MKVEKVDGDNNKPAANSKKKSESVTKKSLSEKLLSPFVAIKEMFAELSPKYIISVTAAVFFCIFVIGAVLIFADPKPINFSGGNADKKIHVKITRGMTTAEIAEELESKGVITSSLKFRFLSRMRGYDGQLKPGTYTFTAGMADEDIFETILKGEKHLAKFTIPEGFTIKEIAARLESLNLADKEDFLAAAKTFKPFDYITPNENVKYAAEGFLFPETYSIESDYSIEEILKLMTDEFNSRLTDEIRARSKELNLSIYDLIILASLVEKEVRYPEDRPIVAQVFLKRLKLEMPLQSDATLQYLMDAPKEDVSIEDTKINSPYNTYQNTGLPPGPVANPGIAAIEAVLNPADTDYLYFVADREGHNHYAYSYEEHLALVNQYR